MRTPSPSSEPRERYHYHAEFSASYKNSPDIWVVVIGANVTTSTFIQILGGDLAVLDQMAIITYTAVGVTMQGMFRRMACPPDGTIKLSSANGLMLVDCHTLEDALAIL